MTEQPAKIEWKTGYGTNNNWDNLDLESVSLNIGIDRYGWYAGFACEGMIFDLLEDRFQSSEEARRAIMQEALKRMSNDLSTLLRLIRADVTKQARG